ncbi:putative terminase small subunit [Synechococcus virus S-ESS1]|uniref:Putative terminase small subunit n=1 Tax=Synechococcus virus S-ESS1 TaxID=1964565 RepID=A0A1V0DX40_9CAUD|nr:terminase small subunit [Synechococcus virus S-ESS1]ARB05701.1 putative terminase small subunit [Synechococcus virus S-ESS1]
MVWPDVEPRTLQAVHQASASVRPKSRPGFPAPDFDRRNSGLRRAGCPQKTRRDSRPDHGSRESKIAEGRMTDDLEARLAAHKDKRKLEGIGLADSALQGVTVSFLAQVFRMDPAKVKRLLVNCPIKETRKRGTTQTQHLYDLAQASQYLVEPKISVEEVLAQIKREDLPPAINTAFWDAQLKRQKWEENAGQLWRTETIRSVIGGMFQTIKFTIQLWADTIERQKGLSEEQRDLLNDMTDQLQQQIFVSLEENARNTMTGPQIAELNDMLDRARQGVKVVLNTALIEGEGSDVDDDFADLI